MSFLISFEWDVWEPQGPVSVCPSSSEPKENGDGKPHGQVEDGRNWTLIYGAPLGSCVLAGRVPQQKPLWADSFRNARFGKPRGQAMGRRRRDTYSTVKPCEQKYSAAAFVSFTMDLTESTVYRLTMKSLATRIDARGRDSWLAVLMDHSWGGFPRRSGNGDLLNFLRGLARQNFPG